MTASFGGINIQGNSNVFVTSSDFKNASGEANMTAAEKTTYTNLVNKTEGSLKQASRFLDLMKENRTGKVWNRISYSIQWKNLRYNDCEFWWYQYSR